MESSYDIAIVGGGIVGAATFYKLQKRYPQLKVILIEKENKLAEHQTGHNSGVIHSGLYYKPGSKKAINCIKGRHEIVAFAKEHNIKHDVCGKIVVATHESELANLERIYNIGLENKIEGLEKIGPDRIKEHEPFVDGIAGLFVACTGIIDYRSATEKMVEIALGIQEKSKLVLGEEVTDVVHFDNHSALYTSKRHRYEARYVIYCSGLHADRLAKKDGVKLKEKVVGFRGDYYELTDNAMHKVKNLIYPVPNPDFPFLGVHFTRMVNGNTECGPNAVFTFKREGYKKTSFSFRDTADALTYIGTWKLFFGNMKFGIDEYRRAFSKRLFLKTLQRMIPTLTRQDIVPSHSAGVRALLLGRDGETRDDFRIEYFQNSIHVLNAPSPAATASLAIGDDVADMAQTYFKL